jgi:hypothetical protein
MNKTTRDLSTAYHEAGHAIIAWRFGMHLRRVTIEPSEDSHGLVSGNFLARVAKLDLGDIPPRVQRRIENYAVSMLAGTASQRRYRPRSLRSHHGHSDRHNVIELLSYLCEPSSNVMTCYYRLMNAQAHATVQNPVNWRAIQILAKELIRQRTMKGIALRDFIGIQCFAISVHRQQT